LGFAGWGSIAIALASPAIAQVPDGSSTADVSAAAGPHSSDEGPVSAREAKDIIVTGSRIVRRDLVSNTPIVTVQREQLDNTGNFTLESKLQQLPQFAGSSNSQFNASGTSTGAATLNLRNLGDNRNLVLLDGRRLEPSTSSFAIDINVIPQNVIDTVEVISGGASAVYGSDALSGVVNFKLKHHFEGLQLDGFLSRTQHGGAGNEELSGLIGTNVAGGRGNIFLSVDYSNRSGLYNSQRDFYSDAARQGSAALGGSGFLDYGYLEGVTPNPSNPLANAANPAVLNTLLGAPVGTDLTGANIAFNNDGTLFNQTGARIYNYRGALFPNYALVQQGPNQAVVYNNQYNLLTGTPLKRYSLFGSGEYDVTDGVTAFFQGAYTHYRSQAMSPPGSGDNFWVRTIQRDPALEPVAVRTLLDSRADPSAPYLIGSSTSFAGPARYEINNDVFQLVAGLRGRLGGDTDITWEIYGSHGETHITNTLYSGGVSFRRLQEVQGLPDYGAGSSNLAFGGSCTSGISPFGQLNSPAGGNNPNPSSGQLVSQDCLDYVTVNPSNRTVLKQDVLEGTVQGKVLDLPAGDLRFAAGASYRKNSYAFNPDEEYAPESAGQSDLIGLFGQLPTIGATKVKEVYGELLVPLLKDLPFVRSMSVNLAYRYSDYNTSGGVSTYKVDGDWAVNDWLRFRGGYQRAVRAPNVSELFGAAQQVFQFNSPDPCLSQTTDIFGNNPANPNRANAQALCAALVGGIPAAPGQTAAAANAAYFNSYTGLNLPIQVGQLTGNPDLKPERADTFTAGVVLRPHLSLPGSAHVSLTVDYYNIRIKGAISSLGAGDVYRACFNGQGTNADYDPASPFCAGILRAPAIAGGVPLSVAIQFQNQGGIKTSGVDTQLNASIEAGPGQVGLNVVVNYLDSFKISQAPGSPFFEYAGATGGYFRWKTFTTLSYTIGDVLVGVRHHFLGGVDDSSCRTLPSGTACPIPGVPSYNLFDAFFNLQLTKGISLRGGIDNLFDKSPPSLSGLPGYVDTANYDILGRRFYTAIRAKF